MFRAGTFPSLAAAILVTAGLLVPSPGSVFAAKTLTVTTTLDDGQPCTASHCSFRAALTQAQADGSGDTIAFKIPASDTGCDGTPAVCTIYPLSPLPDITASH